MPAARANVVSLPVAIAVVTAARQPVASSATEHAVSRVASAAAVGVARHPAISTATAHEAKASRVASQRAVRAGANKRRAATRAPALTKTVAEVSIRVSAASSLGLTRASLPTTLAIGLKAPTQTATARAVNVRSALENVVAGGDAGGDDVAVVVVAKAAIAKAAHPWVPTAAGQRTRLSRSPRPRRRATEPSITAARPAEVLARAVESTPAVVAKRVPNSLQSSGHRLHLRNL